MKDLFEVNHTITVIEKVMAMGGTVAISVSGGKDSQAMAIMLKRWAHEFGWPWERFFCIHADLGRVEWPQTPGMVEWIARDVECENVIVRREQGDLLARWQERMEKLKGTGKPFWSSAKNRYCTSDMKRGPINKYLRKYDLIVSCEGIRREESSNRAKKPYVEVRGNITSTHYMEDKEKKKYMGVLEALEAYKPGKRLAFTINPIIDFVLPEVWATYGHTVPELRERRKLYKAGNKAAALDGWSFHPAYVFGNERLSCVICVLGSDNDICNGADHNPELARTMLEMEEESGATFKNKKSLKEILQKT